MLSAAEAVPANDWLMPGFEAGESCYLYSGQVGAFCERSTPVAVLVSSAERSRLKISSLSMMNLHTV